MAFTAKYTRARARKWAPTRRRFTRKFLGPACISPKSSKLETTRSLCPPLTTILCVNVFLLRNDFGSGHELQCFNNTFSQKQLRFIPIFKPQYRLINMQRRKFSFTAVLNVPYNSRSCLKMRTVYLR